MRVFYFTGAQFALSNLALRRVKISRYRELNDPFELLGVNLANDAHRAVFRRLKDELDQDKGLICFSRNWKNPLLWGHYGEKHTGIALGFDIPDAYLKPVKYASKLAKFTIDPKTGRPPRALIDDLVRLKFRDWKYEDEMRLFVQLDHATAEGGKYFYPFGDELKLRDVILGPRCELPVEGLRDLVKGYPQKIEIIKSRIAFTKFEVLENKAATRADTN